MEPIAPLWSISSLQEALSLAFPIPPNQNHIGVFASLIKDFFSEPQNTLPVLFSHNRRSEEIRSFHKLLSLSIEKIQSLEIAKPPDSTEELYEKGCFYKDNILNFMKNVHFITASIVEKKTTYGTAWKIIKKYLGVQKKNVLKENFINPLLRALSSLHGNSPSSALYQSKEAAFWRSPSLDAFYELIGSSLIESTLTPKKRPQYSAEWLQFSHTMISSMRASPEIYTISQTFLTITDSFIETIKIEKEEDSKEKSLVMPRLQDFMNRNLQEIHQKKMESYTDRSVFNEETKKRTENLSLYMRGTPNDKRFPVIHPGSSLQERLIFLQHTLESSFFGSSQKIMSAMFDNSVFLQADHASFEDNPDFLLSVERMKKSVLGKVDRILKKSDPILVFLDKILNTILYLFFKKKTSITQLTEIKKHLEKRLPENAKDLKTWYADYKNLTQALEASVSIPMSEDFFKAYSDFSQKESRRNDKTLAVPITEEEEKEAANHVMWGALSVLEDLVLPMDFKSTFQEKSLSSKISLAMSLGNVSLQPMGDTLKEGSAPKENIPQTLLQNSVLSFVTEIQNVVKKESKNDKVAGMIMPAVVNHYIPPDSFLNHPAQWAAKTVVDASQAMVSTLQKIDTKTLFNVGIFSFGAIANQYLGPVCAIPAVFLLYSSCGIQKTPPAVPKTPTIPAVHSIPASSKESLRESLKKNFSVRLIPTLRAALKVFLCLNMPDTEKNPEMAEKLLEKTMYELEFEKDLQNGDMESLSKKILLFVTHNQLKQAPQSLAQKMFLIESILTPILSSDEKSSFLLAFLQECEKQKKEMIKNPENFIPSELKAALENPFKELWKKEEDYLQKDPMQYKESDTALYQKIILARKREAQRLFLKKSHYGYIRNLDFPNSTSSAADNLRFCMSIFDHYYPLDLMISILRKKSDKKETIQQKHLSPNSFSLKENPPILPGPKPDSSNH